MKGLKSRMTRALSHGSIVETCDNSGAKWVKVTNVKGLKTVKGRKPSCGIGDLIQVAVKKGTPQMRKQVMFAVIVRQKKAFRRPNGMRVAFEDNAIVVLKDDKGNPKGTILKGPIAKEACERWPGIGKIATVVV
ncbi:50S ribosomal protein L14 [Candidatus Woesearchaeota archaeon]|nr:50S ribosomal protein L14 [Candidatus Woesearchaeota archaeon]